MSGSNHNFQKNVITNEKHKMSKKIMSKQRDPLNKVPLVPEEKNPYDEVHVDIFVSFYKTFLNLNWSFTK